jgi:hypothetical protein
MALADDGASSGRSGALRNSIALAAFVHYIAQKN